MRALLVACTAWIALAAAHAAAPDGRLRRLGVPEDAQVEPWVGVPDRTLVAWVTSSPRPDGQGDDAHDLHLLVLATDTGKVIAGDAEKDAYVWPLSSDSVKLSAFEFGLARGKPSFAIDAQEEHHGCASSTLQTQALYELDGGAIRQVLDDVTLDSQTNFCTGDENSHSHTDLLLAKTRHRGHLDLVLETERSTETCDKEEHCETRTTRTRETLLFDGHRYVSQRTRPVAPAASSSPSSSTPEARNAALAEMRRRFPGRRVDEAALVSGDFDGDGVVDHAALVYPDSHADTDGPLVAVVLGAATGPARSIASHDFPHANGDVPGLAFKHGALTVERGASDGCCTRINETFKFRWRAHGLRLVGFDYGVFANGDRRDDHGQSINLLTGDVMAWTDNEAGRREHRAKRAPVAADFDGFDYLRFVQGLGALP